MKRHWKPSQHVPTPEEWQATPAGALAMTHFLAGMGRHEMVIWAHRGGWIPPALIPAFQSAMLDLATPPPPPREAAPIAPARWTTRRSPTLARTA